MKSKGRIVLLVIGLILIFSIVFGVYFLLFNDNNKDIKYNNPRDLVKSYVTSLIKEDYATAYKHINLPYNSFVNKKDYIDYISSKQYYKELKKYNKIKNIEEEDALSYLVTLKDKNNNLIKINVYLIERTTRDYRIDESDMYLEGFKLIVPKNTEVVIDGIRVNDEVYTKSDKYTDTYTLPAIAKNKKNVVLKNRLGSKELLLDVNGESNEEELTIELTNNDIKNRAFDYIKEVWNEMYEHYDDDDDVSSIKNNFDPSVSESKIKSYYESGFDKISAGPSDISRFGNYEIVEVVDNPNEKCLITTDEIITVNFGYELAWDWMNTRARISLSQHNMRRYSSIRLRIVQNHFVIYDVVDSGLFSYASQYTLDY